MNDSDKTKMLKELLEPGNLSDIETVGTVEKLIHSIDDRDERTEALVQFAKALAVMGQWDKAESLARSIESSYDKANAFREIALELLHAEKQQEAIKILSEAEKVAQLGDVAWVVAKSRSVKPDR